MLPKTSRPHRHFKLLLWFLIFIVSPVFARGSFGDIASTLLEPIDGISKLIKFICATVGGGMIMASIVKFKEYWQQTTEMELLSILTLFIVGVALLTLFFLPIF